MNELTPKETIQATADELSAVTPAYNRTFVMRVCLARDKWDSEGRMKHAFGFLTAAAKALKSLEGQTIEKVELTCGYDKEVNVDENIVSLVVTPKSVSQ